MLGDSKLPKKEQESVNLNSIYEEEPARSQEAPPGATHAPAAAPGPDTPRPH